jgi:TolB-like protein
VWWASRWVPKTGTTPGLSTLAVLPFKPLVSDARDELLEFGMADSLIARLSTVPGLVVRSIGSVRRYAGADQDPLRAARDLDVAWIVDGSLQRRGDQLRVALCAQTAGRRLGASTRNLLAFSRCRT